MTAEWESHTECKLVGVCHEIKMFNVCKSTCFLMDNNKQEWDRYVKEDFMLWSDICPPVKCFINILWKGNDLGQAISVIIMVHYITLLCEIFCWSIIRQKLIESIQSVFLFNAFFHTGSKVSCSQSWMSVKV